MSGIQGRVPDMSRSSVSHGRHATCLKNKRLGLGVGSEGMSNVALGQSGRQVRISTFKVANGISDAGSAGSPKSKRHPSGKWINSVAIETVAD